MSRQGSLSPDERKSHLRNLVSIALKDGALHDAEKSVIAFAANKWGLSDRELDEVMADPDKIELNLPRDKASRFHQLYDLVEIMIIDGVMKNTEKEICLGLADRLGFDSAAVDEMISGILEGNRAGHSEEMIQLKLQGSVKEK